MSGEDYTSPFPEDDSYQDRKENRMHTLNVNYKKKPEKILKQGNLEREISRK